MTDEPKEENTFHMTSPLPEFFSPPDGTNISFYNDNKLVGKLITKDGRMTFEGEADESATLFISYVCDKYDVLVRSLRLEIADLKLKEKNNETEVLEERTKD